MKKTALFPGTFEVFHDGHINILKRSLKLFDYIYVVVSNNSQKKSSPLEVRYQKTKEQIEKLKLKNVDVILNDGLLSNVALKLNSYYIIRGVRNDKDFGYEMELFYNYKKYLKSLEVVLFFSEKEYVNVSSSNLINKKQRKK